MTQGSFQAVKRWKISSELLIAVSVLTTFAFSLICGSILLEMRQADEALAKQSLTNLAATVDSDISRNIEIYDLSLRAVASNMVDLDTARIERPMLYLILFDHAATAEHFGAIRVLDGAGDVKLDSAALEPVEENYADEDYFRIHRDNPDVGLYISSPRMYRGALSVVMSRRIATYEGEFRGVVVGSLRYSYFNDLFSHLMLSANDRITVLRRDGTLIARQPFLLESIGTNLSYIPGIRTMFSQKSGSLVREGAADHLDRLFAWHNSERPLVVEVSKTIDDIFGTWRRQALKIGGLMLVLIFLIGVAAVFLIREMGRRARAEERLAHLANTDALTGVRNRRSFDDALAAEWQRARMVSPLSLLLFDADHFKSFNDTFGHQAGDQVLIRIAGVIGEAARRVGDCAARYGGEEFALLLPDTDGIAAMAIAEEVRRRVEQLSAEKWTTTVSVGVATLIPSPQLSPEDLIKAADTALYAAKEQGRNRCVAANLASLSRAA